MFYVVDDETIFRIVQGIAGTRMMPPGYADSLEGRAALAGALKAMAVSAYAAYAQRYEKAPPEKGDWFWGFAEVPGFPTQTPIQFLKALREYLYQCGADERVKDWPLYVYLDRVVQRSVMMEIISALPEYREAPEAEV